MGHAPLGDVLNGGEDGGWHESLSARRGGQQVWGQREIRHEWHPLCALYPGARRDGQRDGHEHLTLVPCEVWGKKAEGVSDLAPGQLVLFEGKLARRKKGEAWELCVSGFDVTPLAMTGSAHEARRT